MVKFKAVFLIALSAIILGAFALVVFVGLNTSQSIEDSSAASEFAADGCSAFHDNFNKFGVFDYKYLLPTGDQDESRYITEGNLKVTSPAAVYGPRVGKNFTLSTEVNGIFENPFTSTTFGVDSRRGIDTTTPEWNAYFTIGYFESTNPSITFTIKENGRSVYESERVDLGDVKDEIRIAIVKDKNTVTAYYAVNKKDIEVGKYTKLKTDKSVALYAYMDSTATVAASENENPRAGITGGTSYDYLKLSCAKL